MIKKIITSFLAIFLLTIGISEATNWDKNAHRIKIEYNSYNAETYNDVLTGKYKSSKKVNLYGDLYLPSKDGKYPIVFVQHGSGGIKKKNLGKWYKSLVPELIKNGFGVFINDSYGGRKTGDTGKDQSKLSGTARVLDALLALEKISDHPNVDSSKIGITGYSFGGFVTHMVANKNLIEALNLDNTFSSHLAVYPTCQASFKKINLTGKPMLFLLGEKDNWTPAKFCIDYVEKMEKQGINAKYILFKDAYHGFTTAGKRTCSDCWKLTKCGEGYINSDGFYVWAGKEHKGTWKSMTKYLGKKCSSRGVKLGGSKKVRNQTLQDTISFFKETLGS